MVFQHREQNELVIGTSFKNKDFFKSSMKIYKILFQRLKSWSSQHIAIHESIHGLSLKEIISKLGSQAGRPPQSPVALLLGEQTREPGWWPWYMCLNLGKLPKICASVSSSVKWG